MVGSLILNNVLYLELDKFFCLHFVEQATLFGLVSLNLTSQNGLWLGTGDPGLGQQHEHGPVRRTAVLLNFLKDMNFV